MYRNEPSSSGGMNSRPKPGNAAVAAAQTRLARRGPGTNEKTRAKPSQIMAASSTSATGNERNAILCSRHQPRIRA